MRSTGAVLAFLLLACFSYPIETRAECIDYRDYLHVAGRLADVDRVQAVASSGSYVYATSDELGFVVVDVSEPTSPQVVGSVSTWSGTDLAVSGDLVFLVTGYQGHKLVIIDVSEPSNPRRLSIIDTPPYPEGIAVSGDYAYIANGEHGLQVVSLLDPAAPEIVATLDTPDWAYAVDVSGDLLTIADAAGLIVVSIADPLSPELISITDTPDYATDVVIADSRAYVTVMWPGLFIYDLSDPQSPALLGVIDTDGNDWEIVVQDQFAYIASLDRGLHVVDVSDPSHPTLVGWLHVDDLVLDVAVTGDLVFLAAIHLNVVKCHNPWSPTPISSLHVPGGVGSVSRVGDLAIVGVGDSSVALVDVGDPRQLQLRGSVALPDQVRGLGASGSLAAVAMGVTGLAVVDLSDRDNPRLLGTLDTPGIAYDAMIRGPYAYVVDGTSGLQVVDLTIPSSPRIVSHMWTESYAWALDISGTHLYVADNNYLYCVDISNAPNLHLDGRLWVSNSLRDIAAAGTRVFAVTDAFRLQIIDVSDPTTPRIVDEMITQGSMNHLCVSGSFLYLGGGSEFQVVSIADPDNPVSRGGMSSAYSIIDLEPGGDFVLAARSKLVAYATQCYEPAAATGGDLTGDPVCLELSPNPYSGRSGVRIETGRIIPADIEICDVAGRVIRRIQPDPSASESPHLFWDGLNSEGQPVASGVFWVRSGHRGTVRSSRLVVLR